VPTGEPHNRCVKFTVLSHAGLQIEGAGVSLVIDPWLVGSCYWRSWWNYPPPSPELLAQVRADYLYLTHIHWDHFHGPSLRRFPRTTPVLVPKGHYGRIRRDLERMGFSDVRELSHGGSAELAPGFRVWSYQVFPFLDSALVAECDGVCLLNANDAKFLGGPLDQILGRHPKIDFVFRSHSSANGRLCFEVVDQPDAKVDDDEQYLSSFAAFARRSGARFAVPFASNHCFLHRDVYALNDTVQTPARVEAYFRRHHIRAPELAVMVSGDSWDSRAGFAIAADGRRWFAQRAALIAAYRDAMQDKLEASYAREAKALVKREELERYVARFAAALPAPVRWWLRGRPITFVLSGARRQLFEVDFGRRTVRAVDPAAHRAGEPAEIHTSAFVLRQCMALDLFAHLPTSKRVRYRVTRKTLQRLRLVNLLLLLYESELLPIRRALRGRFFHTWALRWRELLLYGRIALDLLRGRRFRQERYLGGGFADGKPAKELRA
jgi:UDP-MurNAc hydroxylase